jgi:hypothetical protein
MAGSTRPRRGIEKLRFQLPGGKPCRDDRGCGLRRHERDLQLRRGLYDERLFLEDDKNFFAVYNPALTIREDVFKQYPQMRKIFVPVSQRLDTETLRDLNYAVDVEGKTLENVAETWLKEEGSIE